MLRTRLALVAIAILCASVPSLAWSSEDSEMVDNPMYAGWANQKPGATATVLEKTTYSNDKNPVPDEKTVTYTLVSVTPEKVVVKAVVTEQELLGTVESAPTQHSYPAKLKKSYLTVAAPELNSQKGAEEAITFNGDSLPCQTLTGSYKKDGETVEFKAWINSKIPGGVVKRTRTLKEKDETITTTITLQSYKAE